MLGAAVPGYAWWKATGANAQNDRASTISLSDFDRYDAALTIGRQRLTQEPIVGS
jgi:hypothetical protein